MPAKRKEEVVVTKRLRTGPADFLAIDGSKKRPSSLARPVVAVQVGCGAHAFRVGTASIEKRPRIPRLAG